VHGLLQLRLTFGKQAYCVSHVGGEDAADVAKNLRRLAGQVAEEVVPGCA
jgi:hypothetical protein